MLTRRDSYRLVTRPSDEPKNLDGGSVCSYSVFPSSVLGLKINSARALQDMCQMRHSGEAIFCGLSQSIASLCTLLLAFRVPFDQSRGQKSINHGDSSPTCLFQLGFETYEASPTVDTAAASPLQLDLFDSQGPVRTTRIISGLHFPSRSNRVSLCRNDIRPPGSVSFLLFVVRLMGPSRR